MKDFTTYAFFRPQHLRQRNEPGKEKRKKLKEIKSGHF